MLIPAFSYNQDHEALFRACISAHPAGRPQSAASGALRAGLRQHEPVLVARAGEVSRQLYVHITDYLQIKLQALRLHASQVREPEFHGSPESLELTSRLRGREISVESAEGFGALITARPLTPIMATALSILTDGGAYPFRSLVIAVMAPCGHRLVRRITRSEAVTRRPGPDGRQVQAGVEVAWTAGMEAFAYRHKGLSAPAVRPIAHLA